MKSFILAIMFFIALSFIACSTCSAQQYAMKNGAITKVIKDTTTKAKVADKVYGTKDGITFYQGAKGGIYYWKTSSKTNKPYKCYLKK